MLPFSYLCNTMAKKLSTRKRAIAAGWRSGFEETAAAQLKKLNLDFEYETKKIRYTKPATQHSYTPDFILGDGTIIETKGRWVASDRAKQLLIKQQHPELRIIMCFMNPNVKINKGSKTTYADWCDKNGIEWCTLSTLHNVLK